MPGGNCKFCSEIYTKTFDNFDYGTEEESAELAQQGRILPEYPLWRLSKGPKADAADDCKKSSR